MVNPGTFRGGRKAYVDTQKNIYVQAVAENCVTDTVASIQHGYIKRFSMNMDEEPTPEHLAQVDDSVADPEQVSPSSEMLSDEEHQLVMKVWQTKQDVIKFQMAQLKHCLAYGYWKDRERAAMDSDIQEAFLTLLQQLTGKGFAKPHRISGSNHWQAMDENKMLVEVELTCRMNLISTSKLHAGIRTKVISDLFKALTPLVRKEWEDLSQEQHQNALDEWKAKVDAPLSKDPAKIQKFIQAVIPFMQKILDLVSRLTGMKASFMAGGPKPANGGRLNVISVHAGHTPGNVKMNFGACECKAYQKLIVPHVWMVFDEVLQAIPDAVLSLSSTMEEHADYTSYSRIEEASQPCGLPPSATSTSTTPPGSPLLSHSGKKPPSPPSSSLGGQLPTTPRSSTSSSAGCSPARSPSPSHLSTPSPPPSPPPSPVQFPSPPGSRTASRTPPPTSFHSGSPLHIPPTVEQPGPPLAAATSHASLNDPPLAVQKRSAKAGAVGSSKRVRKGIPAPEGSAQKRPHLGPNTRHSKRLKAVEPAPSMSEAR
ncbi:hypothetical protein DXG01_001479, partial [Tephrocybe rancida]